MLLIIDNYDSFTFNLYQMLGALHPRIEVVRNDRISVEEVAAAGFEGIVLSPGPGRPEDSAVCIDILEQLEGTLPILGVCLGHQAICQVRGARVERGPVPVHGKPSEVHTMAKSFSRACGSPSSLVAITRWWSSKTPSEELAVTARTHDRQVMAVRHTSNPTWGVQFHPESILSPEGDVLLKNFLKLMERHHEVRDLEEALRR